MEQYMKYSRASSSYVQVSGREKSVRFLNGPEIWLLNSQFYFTCFNIQSVA